MKSGGIPDASITASSYEHNSQWDREPKHARLGSAGRYWASDSFDNNAWIQVDLGSTHAVTGLEAEGNYHNEVHHYWVEQVQVQVGCTEEDLMFITGGNGDPKVQ